MCWQSKWMMMHGHDASLLMTQVPFWLCVTLGFIAFTILYPIFGILFAMMTCCLGCFCDFGRRIDNFHEPGPYQPRRGILWVVACVCLPVRLTLCVCFVLFRFFSNLKRWQRCCCLPNVWFLNYFMFLTPFCGVLYLVRLDSYSSRCGLYGYLGE